MIATKRMLAEVRDLELTSGRLRNRVLVDPNFIPTRREYLAILGGLCDVVHILGLVLEDEIAREAKR
jgi:hypothetical protein